MTMQAEDERLGQVAYEAYSANTGGRSLASGDDLPMWGDLQDVYQTAWIAAARAVLMDAAATIVPPPDEPA
jgi:hypothetical protein